MSEKEFNNLQIGDVIQYDNNTHWVKKIRNTRHEIIQINEHSYILHSIDDFRLDAIYRPLNNTGYGISFAKITKKCPEYLQKI